MMTRDRARKAPSVVHRVPEKTEEKALDADSSVAVQTALANNNKNTNDDHTLVRSCSGDDKLADTRSEGYLPQGDATLSPDTAEGETEALPSIAFLQNIMKEAEKTIKEQTPNLLNALEAWNKAEEAENPDSGAVRRAKRKYELLQSLVDRASAIMSPQNVERMVALLAHQHAKAVKNHSEPIRQNVLSPKKVNGSVIIDGNAQNFAFTRPHQMSASELGNNKQAVLNGLGYLPLYTEFFPREEIERLFIPTREEIEQTPTHPIFTGPVCELRFMEPVSETDQFGTQRCLKSFFEKNNFLLAQSTSLSTLGIKNGPVTKNSQCDFYYALGGIVLGVLEMKGAEAFLMLATRQGVGYSSHIALRLLDLGLPPGAIYVPCIICNGIIIQFGVTMVLSPSLPTFVPLSPELNLVRHEREVIAYMNKSCAYMREMHRRLTETPNLAAVNNSVKREILLDLDEHFLKPLTEEVLDRGLGYFNVQGVSTASFDAGLQHMFRGLGRLYRSPEARKHVVFPLSLRTPNSSTCVAFAQQRPAIGGDNDEQNSGVGGSTGSVRTTSGGGTTTRRPSQRGNSKASGSGAGSSGSGTSMAQGGIPDGFTSEQLQQIEQTQKLDYYALVFRDITKDGFRMGTPDRNINKPLFDEFIRGLSEAVTFIHDAGVIHGDLYPSNIFWKEEEGKISIKIIDWDVCHCLDEDSFHPKVRAALDAHEGRNRKAHFGPNHDLRYIEALQIPANNESERILWTEIASGDRVEMNKAFRKIYQLYLRAPKTRK